MKNNWILASFFTLSLTSLSALAEAPSKESVLTLMKNIGAGNMSKQMIAQFQPALRQMIPDADEEFWGKINENMNPDDITELMIPVYQKHLTAAEVKEINAFYSSAAGKKLTKVQPDLVKESIEIGKKWGQDTATQIVNIYKSQQARKQFEQEQE